MHETVYTYQNLKGRPADEWKLLDSLYSLSIGLSVPRKKSVEKNAVKFLAINSFNSFKDLLAVNAYELSELINKPSYNCFTIAKKSKGTRDIFAPELHLKKVQWKLNYYLQACYSLVKPDSVHGFVINTRLQGGVCNIISNAQPHVGKKHLLNLDISNFFSINYGTHGLRCICR